jgi:hypothetical protein
LIAATPLPTPTEMISASRTEPGVVSTATAAVSSDSSSAVRPPVSTGSTPMMHAASQAQLGQAPPSGPTSGTDTTDAAANPSTAPRRARGSSHGVTSACRTNPWATENSRMPAAPRTTPSGRGSCHSPTAGRTRAIEPLVASTTRVTIRARRSCLCMRRC